MTSLPMPALRPMAERDRNPGARWAEFASAEPAFAGQVRARFGLARQHVLATLTDADAPRVSGTALVWDTIATTEPDACDLWLAMTPGSRKAQDLRRDWRFAIHVNPGDQSMAHPDVKLSGTAYEITDGNVKRAFAARHDADAGCDLFRLQLRSVVRTDGSALEVTTWRPGAPLDVVSGE